MTFTQADLPGLFQAVTDALTQACSALNQADTLNQNHGDHMVEIFQIATQAAIEKQEADLSDAMEYASLLLMERAENDSAQVYARGLTRLAVQFRQKQITLDELVQYVRSYLHEPNEETDRAKGASVSRAGDLLKALLSALAEWDQVEAGQPGSHNSLDMGYLFGVGMAYMQAKAQGGGRLEILAETVVSASPLGRIPHRRQSGKLVILNLLQAMKALPEDSRDDKTDSL
jgi:hypothetical protein